MPPLGSSNRTSQPSERFLSGFQTDSSHYSRGDYYFGDDHTFNQTIFDETRSYWIVPIIDVEIVAKARLARVHTSMATNPTFSLTKTGTQFSFGETAAYIIALGDRTLGTVRRAWVEYLFSKNWVPAKELVQWTAES